MKTGDYFKLVGDFAGAVFIKGRWQRFDCESCVRQAGIAKERLQGPMTDAANRAMLGPVMHRHDVELHKAYLSKSKVK